MKKILLAAALALTVSTAAAQAVPEKPVVDRRVELVSIVFRLAENPEYSFDRFKTYTDRIDSHFGAYKEHELIRFARELRQNDGIGFDAPMDLAVSLNDGLKQVGDVVWKDDRWNRKSAGKFVRLLRKFAEESDFDAFFAQNADLYAAAVERFMPVYDAFDRDWYRTFYGRQADEKFVVTLAQGNGPCNYGASENGPGGTRIVYSILGATSRPGEGVPVWPMEDYLPLMVHEFNHSFVNRLIDENLSELQASGEKLFAVVGEAMSNQAYTEWETMMREALVRAAVSRYAKDHGAAQPEIDRLIAEEKSSGFFWIEALVVALADYDRLREAYPTLESYMPRIVELYDNQVDAWIEACRKNPSAREK